MSLFTQVPGDAAGGLYPRAPQQRLGPSLRRGHRLEQGGHLGRRAAPSAGGSGLLSCFPGLAQGRGLVVVCLGTGLCAESKFFLPKKVSIDACMCVHTTWSIHTQKGKVFNFKMSTHSSKCYLSKTYFSRTKDRCTGH